MDKQTFQTKFHKVKDELTRNEGLLTFSLLLFLVGWFLEEPKNTTIGYHIVSILIALIPKLIILFIFALIITKLFRKFKGYVTKVVLWLLTIESLIVIITNIISFYSISKLNNQLEILDTLNRTEEISEEQQIYCSRTERLKNKDYIDRALSLIYEKYTIFQNGNEKIGNRWFFPVELINCIQIIEGDTRESEQAEAFFVYNDENIRENYYPIYIDEDYYFADINTTTLVLVHEITHIRQYVDEINGAAKQTCLDREVEAITASYMFYKTLSEENRKTVDLRIKHDVDLHPGLSIISQIINNQPKIVPLYDLCKDKNVSTTDECLRQHNHDLVMKTVLSNETFIEYCGLE